MTVETPGRRIRLTVNGQQVEAQIEDRQLLVDVVRENLGLTGTKVGCYNGDCGVCTLRLDGEIVKSCLVLAAGVDGSELTTIEGYSPNGNLDDLQQAFWENDAFQCGFCIPGHLFALDDLLNTNLEPSEGEVREALIGNLCRCTGYMYLVDAALDSAQRRRSGSFVKQSVPRSEDRN
jgi:carbon-monoxide dehydrogenase small subunit